MAFLLAVVMTVGGVPATALAEAIEIDEASIQVLEDQVSVENESDQTSDGAREGRTYTRTMRVATGRFTTRLVPNAFSVTDLMRPSRTAPTSCFQRLIPNTRLT